MAYYRPSTPRGRIKANPYCVRIMADKYGPIFTVRLGIHRYLVVSSWEMMKELFTVNDVFVSDRPKSIATDHLSFDYAMFGFLPVSLLWVELRKVTSAHLLSGTRLEQLKHVRASETEISMKQLYRLWSEKKDASGLVLVADAMKWFGELNLNVILRMLAGKRYSGDDEEARRVRRMTKEFFRLMGVVMVADSFPFLRWLDLGGYEKEMKETAREMDTFVSGWLEEHKSKGNVSSHQPEDFMDFLLSSVHNLDLCGFDADTIIKATCMIILSGGSDTIAVTQTWTLTMLLIKREVLKKAQEELDNVVGKGRQVQESDLHNLVYLDAIIKETLRLYTPGQISGPREFNENCTVGGYYVPKGTRLVVNLWKLHRDPRIWSNPNEFRPERFLEKNKEVDARGRHFEYLPFGGGRRMCPGVTFAFQMLHLSLATLLHGFDISAPSDAIIDMDVCLGLTSPKAIPLAVLITPRLSPSLYE